MLIELCPSMPVHTTPDACFRHNTATRINIRRLIQDWKEHLEAQLDSLLGKPVRGTLRVLRGSHNRYAGGMRIGSPLQSRCTHVVSRH